MTTRKNFKNRVQARRERAFEGMAKELESRILELQSLIRDRKKHAARMLNYWIEQFNHEDACGAPHEYESPELAANAHFKRMFDRNINRVKSAQTEYNTLKKRLNKTEPTHTPSSMKDRTVEEEASSTISEAITVANAGINPGNTERRNSKNHGRAKA